VPAEEERAGDGRDERFSRYWRWFVTAEKADPEYEVLDEDFGMEGARQLVIVVVVGVGGT